MKPRSAWAFGGDREPEIYVTAGNGVLNAFVASAFGHVFVVVHSDLFANTLEQNQRALRFIVGHELGHIRLGHTRLWYQLSVGFSGLVPLLGPYLSRLRELSCDRHGAWYEPEGGDDLMLLTAGGTCTGRCSSPTSWTRRNGTSASGTRLRSSRCRIPSPSAAPRSSVAWASS